jgi:predicted N-acetyltransferase YhbS
MPPLRLRPERPADVPAIREVTLRAFAALAVSDHTEHLVIERLREAGALTVSVVVEEDGVILGHAAASPVAIADGTSGWFGLGPVSVRPERQSQGIGHALVTAVLAHLVERGAAGCVVLGHPTYYPRFGFRHHPGLALPGYQGDHFLALAWRGTVPLGEVAYHPAFGA